MPVYLGIDWSQNKHDLCFVNAAGAAIARATIPHSADGFLELDRLREKLGVPAAECWVGLETSHNLLIDFLWARGYTQVYVLPPNVVKSTRGRYRQSGARNDQSDAYLLGDVLRTDQARLQPWHPDSLLTRQLRAQVGWHTHLTRETVRLGNRLRAVLARYYPAALQVFSELTGPVSLQFVHEFPTPAAASALTRAQFETFARQHGYRQIAKLPACFARLNQPQPTASSDTIQIYQTEAVQLAALLLTVIQLQHTVDRELLRLYRQHPDYATFCSLPGAGPVLGPALLAHFGDDRARFPSPAGLQALAGTCPVTESSGKHRAIKFRQACDHAFRHAAQQWAMESLRSSVWAQAYWQQARPRCDSDSHAYRCLANRWLSVAWKLWQTHATYDEAYHLQQRRARSQPPTA
jgi:transposase